MKKEISFSYNSKLKRFRSFVNGKIVQEIIGDNAKVQYLKVIRE